MAQNRQKEKNTDPAKLQVQSREDGSNDTIGDIPEVEIHDQTVDRKVQKANEAQNNNTKTGEHLKALKLNQNKRALTSRMKTI